MTICIFAGTFNPIHNAHIKMADFALKNYGFEKIIFVPSYIPPHKDIKHNLSEHRLNMVKLATAFNPNFEVSDIEYQNNKTSYSIFTIKYFIDKYKIKDKLNFIIGTDAFVKINTWYHSDEIKELVHFIVFNRDNIWNDNVYNEFKQQGWDFEIAIMEQIDISSTNIRSKENVQKNVADSVKDYIEKNELYKY